jgi:hypothetical protein
MSILTTAKAKLTGPIIDLVNCHDSLNKFGGLIPIAVFVGDDAKWGECLKQLSGFE